MSKLHRFQDRIKNKIRTLLYQNLLHRFGLGNRVGKSTWEKQFSDGDWNYLETKAEEGHYHAIVNLYQKYALNGSILDVGCGRGVLFNYLSNSDKKIEYLGIDLSSTAVHHAKEQFPSAKFQQLDFDKKGINQKFNVIIFNETLYYFNRPLHKIKSCINDNLEKDGYLIISMVEYLGHNQIWARLFKNYQVVEMVDIVNDKGQKWKVAVFKP